MYVHVYVVGMLYVHVYERLREKAKAKSLYFFPLYIKNFYNKHVKILTIGICAVFAMLILTTYKQSCSHAPLKLFSF